MDTQNWLHGVRLWYNYQDYLGAIELWQDAIDALEWNDDAFLLDRNYGFTLLEEPCPASSQKSIARLLLFLAGCQLDAQNIPLARRSLVRCLRCCLDNSGNTKDLNSIATNTSASVVEESTTATLAFQEWLCSYEEEAHVQNDGATALLMSRQIVEFAIRHLKTSHYWTDEFQRPGFLYPSIKNSKAHYKGDERPSWCCVLEDNWERIRDEFIQLARGGSTTNHWPAVGASDHRGGSGQHDHKVVDGDWREVVLFGSGARPDLAPFTSNLIRTCVPEAASLAGQGGGEVIFSVLSPNTRIRAHCGSTNLRLTAHLGLSIPSTCTDDCAIRVADQWHTWEEGKVLVFDDSFEHEVKNMTSRHRTVLLIRFWHPTLDPEKRRNALKKAVEAKELDTLRRYNPPLPSPIYKNVEKRGLEQSKCPGCWRNGYNTIRLETMNDPAFVCSCGRLIE